MIIFENNAVNFPVGSNLGEAIVSGAWRGVKKTVLTFKTSTPLVAKGVGAGLTGAGVGLWVVDPICDSFGMPKPTALALQYGSTKYIPFAEKYPHFPLNKESDAYIAYKLKKNK